MYQQEYQAHVNTCMIVSLKCMATAKHKGGQNLNMMFPTHVAIRTSSDRHASLQLRINELIVTPAAEHVRPNDAQARDQTALVFAAEKGA